ncbi:hypothetical protein N0V87_002785 [Didymella glomerata]|uniref:Major facilitator superfamily (MFS) profile domain-containing protein n=1 Tax=Didymella glomerata TaxID=749621 RepID=A0A9W8X3I0_9PLEO|nr:hypothetical protein N0V87_002785 [Didymella glomerata]
MENTAEKDARLGEPSAALVGSGSSGSSLQTRPTTEGDNGIIILNEAANLKDTAYAFSSKKKWWILTAVALCQTSMNFNAAVYSNAIASLNEHYNLGTNHFTNARAGLAWFLIPYGIGCELWAPWSEDFGRWPIMQLSLGTVNIWQILAGASTSWNMVLAARVLGGVCSAGGSVTLGMVADMFDPEDQQFAVLWASLWSCLGSGGIAGGSIEQYLDWRWNFWIQLILGVTVQGIHMFFVPETRSTVMLNKKAKKLREGDPSSNIRGPTEDEKFDWWGAAALMGRPYKMLATEPIVLFLSLLSGFADALIFSFLESYGYVFGPGGWNFTPSQLGIALFALFIGYWAAGLSYVPVIRRHNQKRKRGEVLSPETRLKALLWIAPLIAIGLLGSAFTVTGPPLPWIAPLIFAVLIGWANMAIYFATIDYMVAAYGGKYSASATGGNGFSRDVLAGICSFYTGPMYHKLGNQNATFLLFGLAILLIIPVYWIYKKGPWLRARSKYAAQVEEERQKNLQIRAAQHGQPSLLQQETTNASAPVQAQPYSVV